MEIIELATEKLVLNCNETFFLLWEFGSEEKNNLRAFENHDGPIRVIVNYEWKVISGSADRTIKIWMPELQNEPEITYTGHENEVICLCVMNEFLLSTSLDLNIKMWDLVHNRCLKTFQIEGINIITWIIWIPELKLVMTTSLKGDVKLIDPFDKEANFTLRK